MWDSFFDKYFKEEPFEIVFNGKTILWEDKMMSYDDAVVLAGYKKGTSGVTIVVYYKNNEVSKILTKRRDVRIYNGTIINAVLTNRA